MVMYEGDDARSEVSASQRGERPTASGVWEGEEVSYLANRIVVKIAAPEDDDVEGAAAAIQDASSDVAAAVTNGRIARARTSTRRVVIEIDPGDDPREVAEQLAERDDVEYAEPDMIDHAAVVPNDTRYSDQWSPGVVNAEAAWDLETGDTNVVIGIIDSGISMTSGSLDHDDLDDPSRIVLGTDFVDGGTPRDTNGHGTHVAGIAAAEGNNSAGIAGMNWGSLVYVCRTLDTGGNGSSADFADAVEEITDYAIANGLKAVINYSAGGGDNATKRDACQYASDNGMLVVAATGNDNAGPVIAPASYSTTITGVIAVGSTDEDDTVSSFSNIGPEVTVVAPGRDIMSTMPTYGVTIPAGPNFGSLDGTSMATPLVSGLAALIWSRNPTFTNEKVKDCIKDTAVKLGSTSFDDDWGHGRVDAEAALRCGGITIPPTVVGCGITTHLTCRPTILSTCAPITRIIDCRRPTRLVTCQPSVLRRCPPVPSKLPVACPTSRFTPDCRNSWVDACPSALNPNCGDFRNPGDLYDPVVQPEIRRPVRFGTRRLQPGFDPIAATGEDEEVWTDESGRFWWTTDE